MREKSFEEMRGIDDRIRQAYLKDHKNRPPDDYVESSEGGAVSAERLEAYSETEEMEIIGLLDTELAEIEPKAVDKNGNFRWD